MRRTVVEIASVERLGPLKQDNLRAVLHKQPGSQRVVSHGFFVEPTSFDIDVDLRAGHAKNFCIKLLGPVQVIDRKTEMMNTFDFEHTLSSCVFYSLRNSILCKKPSNDAFDEPASIQIAQMMLTAGDWDKFRGRADRFSQLLAMYHRHGFIGSA